VEFARGRPRRERFHRFTSSLAFVAFVAVVVAGATACSGTGGGPPPDGIQPTDDPCFDTIAVADAWLEPQRPVTLVEVADDRRAYPLAIMTQHEIVNDVEAASRWS
jgi:hypothetical protein